MTQLFNLKNKKNRIEQKITANLNIKSLT